MKQKLKEFMERPITRGDVAKTYAGVTVLYLVVALSFIGKLKYDDWKRNKPKKKKEKYATVKQVSPEELDDIGWKDCDDFSEKLKKSIK